MQCDPNTNGKQTTEDIIIAVSQIHCSSAFIEMNLLIKTKERIFNPLCDAGGRDERCGDLPAEEGQDRDQEDGRL